ncbi:MAG: ABC transporter ATP-binding protein [Algoriphagus sp.]|nr:ABC transporter ATP-binding protein [Algoriphagus sp.]MCE2779486.1 ABC transporter ATP-binding protein [Algoriphagus sp.]
MLIAKGIHKSYGSLEVLKGVDLDISKGEIVSIVGASGAGKSTLLHILGTLDRPDQGQLSLNAENLMQLKGDALAEFRNSRIGFVFQFHNLLPEFTALENICIPGFIQGREEKELNKRAEELGEILGIRHRLDHKPSELSGGEQQRVAVARALINNPDLVFADEPSGNLDTSNARALHDLFFKLRDTYNLSFVLVTHNEELAAMADRKVVMKDGRIEGA